MVIKCLWLAKAVLANSEGFSEFSGGFVDMPVSCSAYGCAKRFVKGQETRFFRFPRDPERRRRWVLAIRRREWQPTEHSRICSDHFVKGMDSQSIKYVTVVYTIATLSFMA